MRIPGFTPGAAGRARAALFGILAFAGAPLDADPLSGGSFVLVGAPSDGGTSSGGAFSITGWVASAGAGTSSGEDFDLTCGLIGVYLSPGDVTLHVEVTAEGNARIWWPSEVAGYQLESTTALGSAAGWQPVEPAPIGNSFTTGPDQAARFFRLRKP